MRIRLCEKMRVRCATTIGAQEGTLVWLHGSSARVKTDGGDTFEVNQNDVWPLEAVPEKIPDSVALRFEVWPRVAGVIVSMADLLLTETQTGKVCKLVFSTDRKSKNPDVIGSQSSIGRCGEKLHMTPEPGFSWLKSDEINQLTVKASNVVIPKNAPAIPAEPLIKLLKQYLEESKWDPAENRGWYAYVRLDAKGELSVSWTTYGVTTHTIRTQIPA